MFGLLNINKPKGLTSRDVVNRIQRLVRPHRVGHAGTLDPLATGVLVVCLGPATRLVEYVQRLRKRYAATFLLGRTSDTEDVDGTVVELAHPPVLSAGEVAAVLPRFIGRIEQVPPAFSAIKQAGQRAYDLARRGQRVDLAARRVDVYALRMRGYDYPSLRLEIECGSGTYVRSLGRDIGRALGTDAVMAELERTAIGDFRVEAACHPEDIRTDTLAAHLLPARLAVATLPPVTLQADELRLLDFGRPLPNRWQVTAPELAGLDEAGELAAILAPADSRWLRPVHNFHAARRASEGGRAAAHAVLPHRAEIGAEQQQNG